MRNITLGMTALFLVLLVAAYIHKQGSGTERTVSLMKSGVEWEVENAAVDKKTKISFIIQDDKGKGLRGLNDEKQNEIRAVIIPPDMKEYIEIQPSFLGKGAFMFTHIFKQKGEYAVFLYEKNKNMKQSFANTRVTIGQDSEQHSEKKQTLVPDSLLTTEIGPYKTSLVFDALRVGRMETLTFQFSDKEGNLRFRSKSGESPSFLFVNESKRSLVHTVAQGQEEKKELSLSVIFPEEGLYKMWGTFYINGREYHQAFVVQVGSKK